MFGFVFVFGVVFRAGVELMLIGLWLWLCLGLGLG